MMATTTHFQRRVGSSDVYIPPLGLGTAPLGSHFAPVTTEEAVATVHYALENGVPFFDTAPWYGREVAERLRIALDGVPRGSYVLATKVGLMYTEQGEPLVDFTRDGILRSLDFSIRTLKLDRFDILHIHAPGFEHYKTAMEQAYPLLADLRVQGVIGSVGNGENFWEPLVDYAREGRFDCFLLAGRYTLLEQGARQALDLFARQGVSIFGAGVYNSGILAKGSIDGAWYQYSAAPPHIVEKVRRIEALCRKHDVPLNAAAVQFVQAHPAITALVIGAESPQQLAGTLRALNTPIPPEFWADLHEAHLIDPTAPVPKRNEAQH